MVCFARDGHLITVDHQIPIGYTFLCATTASSHDMTTINCSIKIFLLAYNLSVIKKCVNTTKRFTSKVNMKAGIQTSYITLHSLDIIDILLLV